MNEKQKFLDECPAWARKSGVKNLLQWEVAKSLVSLSWKDRFDKLDEFRFIVEKVLRDWDNLQD